ncbi:hypothetical protein F3Y22_tig00110716pilonHSYRG00332 [Hibiscus syriacus]|uniref:Uncharacterized protein n=1 Tax=Hibiscus syriacus TaxID=106335 RepID=A0A6A2ZU22_HIBSY|nr:hypothetical protein F3Y22_tig00110716pilonHSYRG00332 [Hibiscus syriacus]
MEDLSFTALETGEVETQGIADMKEPADLGPCLIGKFISQGPVDDGALVKFSSDEAMEIVLKRSPWTCEGNLFSLLDYDSEKGLDNYSFDTMVVWVRIYNLPFGSMTKSMGMALGGCIGSVMVVDIRLVGGNLGEFLRVRVEVDINQPLRRCVFLDSRKSRKPCVCPLKWMKRSPSCPIETDSPSPKELSAAQELVEAHETSTAAENKQTTADVISSSECAMNVTFTQSTNHEGKRVSEAYPLLQMVWLASWQKKQDISGGCRIALSDAMKMLCWNCRGLSNAAILHGWFTWHYGSAENPTIQEHMDCFLEDKDWDDYFRFESCWVNEKICHDKVKDAWLTARGSVLDKIAAVGAALEDWQRDRTSSSRARTKELREFAMMAYNVILLWNTSYFHARASGRQKKNWIHGLHDNNDFQYNDKK